MLLQFGVQFFSVLMRAFQQLNVMQSDYLLMVPTSYGMSLGLIMTTIIIVHFGANIKNQAILFLVTGTSGWFGSWVAVHIHNTWV